MKSNPGKAEIAGTFLTNDAKVLAPEGQHPNQWLSAWGWMMLCPIVNGFQWSPVKRLLDFRASLGILGQSWYRGGTIGFLFLNIFS